MNMRLIAALSGAALQSLVFMAAANANTYDFSFSGTDVSGSGVITTGNTGSPFTVTGVTGTIFDSDIAPGPFIITTLSSYAGADNLLSYPNQPFVDFGGLSFSTVTGGDFNLGLGGSGPFGYLFNAQALNPSGHAVPFPGSVDITLNVSQTPLPTTWTLLLAGFVGLGFFAHRSAKNGSVALAAA